MGAPNECSAACALGCVTVAWSGGGVNVRLSGSRLTVTDWQRERRVKGERGVV